MMQILTKCDVLNFVVLIMDVELSGLDGYLTKPSLQNYTQAYPTSSIDLASTILYFLRNSPHYW